MKTEFRSSFTRDLRTVKDRNLCQHIEELIEFVEQAAILDGIPNLKKLQAAGRYYRVRIGDYRVGLVVKANVVTFVRCLHRKEIYRYFP